MRTKTLQEIKLTGLDNCYLCIYSIVTPINHKHDNIIHIKKQYTFIGLNVSGKKRFIGSFIEDSTNNRFWLDIFETFKNRGINDILFMSINENKSLFKCLKVAFPNVIMVPSLVDTVDNFYKYFPDKFSTKIKEEIKSLFLQENLKDFQNIFLFFKEKYQSYNIISQLINRYLSDIDNLYKYDLNIRQVLFNTYKIAILKRKIITISSEFNYIDDINELLELLLDDLNTLENFTSYHKKEWLTILSSFYTFRNKELEDII